MKDNRSPWVWIPTLYFAEGLPYFIVNTISVVMYKNLGMPNGRLAALTSLLYLPWVIKTSHYSLCTAFMALSMMIPGMFAGYLQEALGYTGFFVLVMVCSILSIGITALAARKVEAHPSQV